VSASPLRGEEGAVLVELAPLAHAETAIERHGDVVAADLDSWSVLPGLDVSGGFLRVERLPVAALLDFVSGLRAAITRALVVAGYPSGRSTIAKCSS
jgi:hypothetical protein